ncbi:MAG: PucR family transcriptional regulator ligand-binding domain-containing protein, partial [Cyanobacteria bacterium J06638_22]
MLTVRETLDFPVFASARLVAGADGLSRSIQWVHVVDCARAHYQWQREGILLLTTGAGLYEQPELHDTLIAKLDQLGFAGLVLSVGHYFDHTPAPLMRQANALGFPIIETPPDLLFIQITEAVLKHIVNQQYDLLQRSAQFNQQLTDLVLQGAGLSELTQTLANLLHRSITVESVLFQVLADAQWGEVDAARRRSLEQGKTTQELVDRLMQSGIYNRLLKTMKPAQVPPIPELGMSMPRIVAPIIVKREIHGYIWIIAGNTPLTPLDELALSHGATVAALILFKEQSVRQATVALQGDFFAQLLNGATDTLDLKEQAQRIGYRLERSHQVWMIHSPRVAEVAHLPLETPMRQWLAQQRQPFLLFPRDQNWVAVVECQTMQAGYQMAIAMIESLQTTLPILIGVGEICQPSNAPNSITLQQSYEQAQETLQIAIALGKTQGAIAFQELGLLHWLYRLSPEERSANIYLTHIETLRAYDAKRNTDLLASLTSYLDHGGALVETAAVLHIHRNTLLHRLERIESLCRVDLKDPIQRLNFHVALKSYYL